MARTGRQRARFAGLDFGTSNCAIGVWDGAAPRLVELEAGRHRMASALYAERAPLAAEAIDEDELLRRVAVRVAAQSRTQGDPSRAAQTRVERALDRAQMLEAERRLMQREVARQAAGAYRDQTLAAALESAAGIWVGDEAVRRHVLEPEDGHFVRSPKNYLAADLRAEQHAVFARVVEHMLAHLKSRAEADGEALEAVVLGRPIMFHGLSGEAGNRRALGTLETAARRAGFRHVEFQYEPVAAALDYERGLDRDQIVLVVDLGGGTTDCSVVEVGPGHRAAADRTGSLLGFAGDRVGGMDLDIRVAWQFFMPLMGKDSVLDGGLVFPPAVLWDAVAVNDVVAQTRFASVRQVAELQRLAAQSSAPREMQRLLRLQDERATYRLNELAELSKIALSSRDATVASLEFLEPGLTVDVTRDGFAGCVHGQLEKMRRLMDEAVAQAGVRPDAVYVTGGTAQSPVVAAVVRRAQPDTEMVTGDAFESVCAGLTVWARTLFA